MQSVILFPAADGTARTAASATGVKSIALLENVVIEGPSCIPIFFSPLRLWHRRPYSKRAVGPVRRVDEHRNHRMSTHPDWGPLIHIRAAVVSFEAFEGRELVKDHVLGPSGNGIQLPRPDARLGAAHRWQPRLNIPGQHFLLVLKGTVVASDLNAGSGQRSLLVGGPSAALASARFGQEVHALTDPHGEHLPALFRQGGADGARDRIAEHKRL